jgi:hypothetical protein
MRLLRQVGVYAKPSICFLLTLALYTECLALRTYSFHSAPRPEIKKPRSPNNRTTSSATLSNDDREAKTQIAENYGRMPLSFEINDGQIDRQVKFFSRGAGYGLYLTSSEAVMVLSKRERGNSNHAEEKQPSSNKVITMKLSGANPRSRVLGLEQLPGKSNHFIEYDLPARICLRCVRSTDRTAYISRRRELECERLAIVFNGHGGCNEVDLSGVDRRAHSETRRRVKRSNLYLRRAGSRQDTCVGPRSYVHLWTSRGDPKTLIGQRRWPWKPTSK